jgi:hypothetical protein
MTPERRAEIVTFVAALPPSMAYVRGCFEDLMGQLDAQAPVVRAAEAWLEVWKSADDDHDIQLACVDLAAAVDPSSRTPDTETTEATT